MHQEPDVDDRAAYTARQLQLRGLVVLEAGADGAPLRVQRSEDARSASPHELRLDGCGLAECPVLEVGPAEPRVLHPAAGVDQRPCLTLCALLSVQWLAHDPACSRSTWARRISALASHPQGEAHLQLLSLRGNRFAAAPAPGTCVAAALCVLDASHNAIADVAPLRGVAGLRALMLAHNAVADLRPLQVRSLPAPATHTAHAAARGARSCQQHRHREDGESVDTACRSHASTIAPSI